MIKLSLQSIPDFTSTQSEEIVIDENWESFDGIFNNCTFSFENKSVVKFTRGFFTGCEFVGCDGIGLNQVSLSNIHFMSSNVIDCKIQNNFSSIRLEDSKLKNFKDFSKASTYTFAIVEVADSSIEGECLTLDLNQTRFSATNSKKGLWNKKIKSTATCHIVAFDNLRVNPFYLATKCREKSTLDLTGAVLVDDWSMLRKKYAGLSLFIVFMLTFIFFLPLFTHTFFLVAISKIEATGIQLKKTPLWQALLFGGKSGWYAFLYGCLTITLLVYNVGRLYMTISIAKLREEERFLKDANFQLVSIHPEKIKTQLEVDRVLSVIFWISIGYTLLKLIDTLRILVPVFN